MKTDCIDRIKQLGATARSLHSFWRKYKETVALPGVDKYGASFNGDDRFSVFGVPIRFTAYVGQYGNSSCHTFCGDGLDAKICSDLFIRAINERREEIFETMARLAEADQSSLLGDAKRELDELTQLLSSAETIPSAASPSP